MANLVVTFTGGTATGELRQDQPNFPKFIGSEARTELLFIGPETLAGNLIAAASETFVVLKAGCECFVNIGSSPVAVNGEGWHLSTDQQLELFVSVGESVAVLEGTTISGVAVLVLLASETNTALVIVPQENHPIVFAVETDTAFVVVPSQV